MEQEKTVGMDEKADKLRAEKEVALKDALRKVIKKNLKKSKRKHAIDLEREKNKENSDVKVELSESELPSELTAKIMNIVRKHAKNLLETRCPLAILEDAQKEFKDFKDCQGYPIHIAYAEWNGAAHFGMASISNIRHANIKINNKQLVILFLWSTPQYPIRFEKLC